jgi:hypothetical protein
MSRFGMTGKVVAKADREIDPYQHIDHLRQEVFDLGEELRAQRLEIQALKNENAERVTESGVWTIVKNKLDAEAVSWMKWGIRISVGSLLTAMLTGIGWLIKKAFFS